MPVSAACNPRETSNAPGGSGVAMNRSIALVEPYYYPGAVLIVTDC